MTRKRGEEEEEKKLRIIARRGEVHRNKNVHPKNSWLFFSVLDFIKHFSPVVFFSPFFCVVSLRYSLGVFSVVVYNTWWYCKWEQKKTNIHLSCCEKKIEEKKERRIKVVNPRIVHWKGMKYILKKILAFLLCAIFIHRHSTRFRSFFPHYCCAVFLHPLSLTSSSAIQHRNFPNSILFIPSFSIFF